ncbi:hypothetical protein HHK36_020389 [Tetracentron sinense]|uniref:Transposase MuDR plant domain-containing protein n=1 Tax=Tetracentron sinense TaxID=13715 RepID=A0A834YTS5_TETSI|nr:hypothetical protein HHK36_020389 [Tetracentron sinense]
MTNLERFVLIFVLAIALTLDESRKVIGIRHEDLIFSKHNVYVGNDLGEGVTLDLRCASKDDDLGTHVLPYGQNYTWEFRSNFWGTTLFWCDFKWGNVTDTFTVYDDDYGDQYRYTYTHWLSRMDGLYYFHHSSREYELFYSWGKMGDDMWDVDIHYGGHFINGGNGHRYVGGQITFFCVNRNLASYTGLLDYLGSICNLPPNSVPFIYYKISNTELGDETKIVENDKQLVDMFDEMGEWRKIEMYVEGKDFTPLERDEGHRTEDVILYPSFDWPLDSSVCITAESESDEDYIHDKHVIYNEIRDVEDPPLAVGLEFTCSKQFQVALRQYAIKNSFDVIFQFNSKRCVTAYCKTEDCQWRIHTSLKNDKSTFQAKNFISKHFEHCQAINLAGNKMATESWIVEKISERIIGLSSTGQ